MDEKITQLLNIILPRDGKYTNKDDELGTLDEIIRKINDGIMSLEQEKINFIENKINAIIDLDNQIANSKQFDDNSKQAIMRLQKLVLLLYIKKEATDCTDELNEVIQLSTKKIDQVNEIMEHKLAEGSVNSTTSSNRPNQNLPVKSKQSKQSQLALKKQGSNVTKSVVPTTPRNSSPRLPPVQKSLTTSRPSSSRPPSPRPSSSRPSSSRPPSPRQESRTNWIPSSKDPKGPNTNPKPETSDQKSFNDAAKNSIAERQNKGKYVVPPLNLSNVEKRVLDPEDILRYIEGSQFLNSDKKNQSGGTLELEQKEKIKNYLKNLKSAYDIFKGNLMLRIVSLLIDKEMFDETFGEFIDKENINNLVEYFFVDVSNLEDITERLDLNKFIARDTYICKLYNGNSDKKIFGYTLIKKLSEYAFSNIDQLTTNDLIFGQLFKIIVELDKKITYLHSEYNELFFKQEETIKEGYAKFLNENRKVFTFIKIRNDNDVDSINPRYNIKVVNDAKTISGSESKYLLIKYNNVDGKFGYFHAPANEIAIVSNQIEKFKNMSWGKSLLRHEKQEKQEKQKKETCDENDFLCDVEFDIGILTRLRDNFNLIKKKEAGDPSKVHAEISKCFKDYTPEISLGRAKIQKEISSEEIKPYKIKKQLNTIKLNYTEIQKSLQKITYPTLKKYIDQIVEFIENYKIPDPTDLLSEINNQMLACYSSTIDDLNSNKKGKQSVQKLYQEKLEALKKAQQEISDNKLNQQLLNKATTEYEKALYTCMTNIETSLANLTTAYENYANTILIKNDDENLELIKNAVNFSQINEVIKTTKSGKIIKNPNFLTNVKNVHEVISKMFDILNNMFTEYNTPYSDDWDRKNNYSPSVVQMEKSMESIKNNNNIDPREYYYFGPFDGYYASTQKNKNIAEDAQKIIFENKLKKNEDVCVIGYGQSGSGKTSSLIYRLSVNEKTKEPVEEDGILIEICNDAEFVNHFDKIKLEMYNIYIWHGARNNSSVEDIKEKNDYKVTPMTVFGISKPTFSFNENKWFSDDVDQTTGKRKHMALFINEAFENKNLRQVEPTPNNPNSSRSHVIVCMTLYKKGTDEDPRKFIVCDLAGVENVFDCKNINEIIKFDDKYGLSRAYNSEKIDSANIKFDRHYCDQKNNQKNVKTKDDPELNSGKFGLKYNENIGEMKKYLDHYQNLKNDFDEWIETHGLKLNNQSGGDVECVDEINDEILKCDKKLNYSKNSLYTSGTIDDYISNVKNNINDVNKKLQIIDRIKLIIADFKNNSFNYDKWNSIYKLQKETKSKNLIEWQEKNNVSVTAYDLLSTYYKGDLIKNLFRKELMKNLFKKVESSFEQMFRGGNTSMVKDKFDEVNVHIGSDVFKKELNELGNIYLKLLEDYSKELCEINRLNKLVYNCNLRKNEGFMINRSLADMRNDIQEIIKKSLVLGKEGETSLTPIFFEKEIFPYCRNIQTHLNDEIFDDFYLYNPKTESLDSKDLKKEPTKINNSVSGILLDTMINKLEVDVNKLNFAVFTVINLTNDGKTNNPPNPPYINLSQLINNRNVLLKTQSNTNIKNLKETIIDIIHKTKLYSFYNNMDAIKQFQPNENAINSYNKEVLITLANGLINTISANNPLTLIGSLESTDLLQNTTYVSIPCSYNNKKPKVDEYNDLNLISWNNSSTVYEKNPVEIEYVNKILNDLVNDFPEGDNWTNYFAKPAKQ